MAANNRKNTRILLFLILCIRMALTVNANDFLFTSINTAQGLSDNQIRYILQLPDGRMVLPALIKSPSAVSLNRKPPIREKSSIPLR